MCEAKQNEQLKAYATPSTKHHGKHDALSAGGQRALATALAKLLRAERWPTYLTAARVVPLSKTASATPPLEKIRVVAILPALTKLIELIVLADLEKHERER